MKILVTITFLSFATFSFGQTEQSNTIVVNVTADYKPANIELIKSHTEISSLPTLGGKIKYKGLDTGYYTFQISGHGKTKIVSDSIYVKNGQLLELHVAVTGPCLYDHPADQIPICPNDHTDTIIPIVYGLIGQASESASTVTKVHLGGCVVTDCDPKYYCTKHKVEF
jgi:hypothetical protein